VDEKGHTPIPVPLAIQKMIIGAFLSLVIFLIIFDRLKAGGVDPTISSVLAVAAGFGSLTLIIKLHF
jgi:hypothetical protein